MDLLLAICQGLGLAIAAGLVIGVVLPPTMPSWGAFAGAAPLGILVCGGALNGAEEAIWPAVPVGVLGAGLAASVSRDVAAGAARRQDGPTDPDVHPADVVTTQTMFTAALVVFVAVVTAAISIFAPPASLVAAAALAWLALSRRRREERKHEGLRVLR